MNRCVEPSRQATGCNPEAERGLTAMGATELRDQQTPLRAPESGQMI
jgi:hypothetical protein